MTPENKIVGVGYNGLPWGCEDDEFPWANREGDMYDTKYPYVVHAELNAILNSIQNLHGCRIYVSLFPCHECVKAIIQSGIKEIVYEDDKYSNTPSDKAANVCWMQLKSSILKWMLLKLISYNKTTDRIDHLKLSIL